MAKKTGKTLTDKIADSIVTESIAPTTALEKKLATQKNSQMKKKLLLNEDEDSDEEGNTFTNPVALQDTEANKYQPPDLNIAAINDSRTHDIDVLAKSPRSQLSQEEKKVLDRAAISDALAAKQEPDKLKNLTPKSGQPFKPPAATQITT